MMVPWRWFSRASLPGPSSTYEREAGARRSARRGCRTTSASERTSENVNRGVACIVMFPAFPCSLQYHVLSAVMLPVRIHIMFSMFPMFSSMSCSGSRLLCSNVNNQSCGATIFRLEPFEAGRIYNVWSGCAESRRAAWARLQATVGAPWAAQRSLFEPSLLIVAVEVRLGRDLCSANPADRGRCSQRRLRSP